MKITSMLFIFILMLNTKAQAQECESVISLSKIITTTVQDKNAVDANSATFCSEYAQSKRSGRTMEISASYKFLAASYGATKVSAEDIASRYCSTSDNYSKRNDAYRQYVESISPNAYSAYEQCVIMSQKDLKFKVNNDTLLPTEMSISVSFVQSVAQSNASLFYTASSGIRCAWEQEPGKTFTFTSSGSTGLTCTRTDATRRGYVLVRRTNSIDEIAFAWLAMDSHGKPIDTIADMQNKSLALSNRITALEEKIMATNLAATATQASTLQKIDTVDRRFTKLRLSQTCSPSNWLPVAAAGACPAGFKDTGLLTSYSAPGGPHGFGGNCRICYKVEP